MDGDLPALVYAARKTIKAQRATLRNLLAILASLEEQLDALSDAQPQEAQRNGSKSAASNGTGESVGTGSTEGRQARTFR